MKAEEAEKARQEEIERAAKAFEELLARTSEETRRILKETGWDGKAIIDKNNTAILDQNQLAKYGMPGETSGCVFLSTVGGVAKALDIELTPEQIKQVYDLAKDNKAIGVNWGTYGVDDYDKLAQAVATVAGVNNNAKVGPLTLVNRNDETSRVEATKITQ